MLHNKDSLFYKVFKSKYFPNCTILDEGVELNGLYAWLSILKARRVVWLGSKWRLGDGKRVRIRGDKWLSDSQVSQVVSPQKNFPNNTKVYALIDEERGKWLEDKVREEFLPHEAEAIISIPLSNLGTKDKLIWSATSNGCYSTKSAYHLLSMGVVVSEPGPSIPNAHNQFWRQLWSLNVPMAGFQRFFTHKEKLAKMEYLAKVNL